MTQQPREQPQPQLTEDEALALITRLVGTGARMELYPFEFGWLARRVLSGEETARGMRIGQGSYIIDRTGVVTVQSSLPVPLIIGEYVEARRQGRIIGRQVWPEPNPPRLAP